MTKWSFPSLLCLYDTILDKNLQSKKTSIFFWIAITEPEASLIEAYRKLFPAAQEYIGGLVISLAKLHTLARQSGRARKSRREAVEDNTAAYELAKQEAALIKAYRKLEPTEQESARNVVTGLVEALETVWRYGAEQRQETDAISEKADTETETSTTRL